MSDARPEKNHNESYPPMHRLPSSRMVSCSSVRMACVIKFSSSHMVSYRYATRISGTLVRLMSLLSCPSLV
ncbi:hypothetical protein EYF80_006895 [Liparis tanakae]|uniref:Uncharacterized protein n=1 Tax=Liparis tanakae TaxID=230148 RepID=A0A4Z2IZN5_9TELE|nr:hypothetical protein EYF80_006895 [Liparis tanakae]